MKHEVYAGLFLVITLTILAALGWGGHQRTLRQEAEGKLLAATLELEGAHRALSAKPKEIIKFVEVPAAVKAAVKSGAVTPLAAVKGTAKSNVVNIPCPEPVRSIDESLTKGLAPQEDTSPGTVTSTAPVWFEVKGNLFIGQIKHGEAMWSGTIDGAVHSGEFEAPIEFDPEHIDFVVKVNEDIGKALDYSNRSWIRKHFGVACPGASVTYNPLNARPVDVALTCGVAMVWHPW